MSSGLTAFCAAVTKVRTNLVDDLKNHVRHETGPITVPAKIEFVEKLPKTRSGKIMRRVLKAQAMGKDVGDISTLES